MIYIDILNTYSTAPKGFAAWLSWTFAPRYWSFDRPPPPGPGSEHILEQHLILKICWFIGIPNDEVQK